MAQLAGAVQSKDQLRPSNANRRKTGCGVHAETGRMEEPPIMQFQLTCSRLTIHLTAWPHGSSGRVLHGPSEAGFPDH